MDNFDLVNFNEGGGLPPSGGDDKKTIPFDDSDSAPPAAAGGVSRKPLDLGGSKPVAPAAPAAPPKVAKPAVRPTAKPVAKPAAAATVAKAVAQANPSPVAVTERITRMKIFVIKLHHGSLEYVEEQIAEWLRDNPDVVIKRTDVSVGEVQAKKTEPNLIINVWY